MTRNSDLFIGVDWSGARGRFLPGIAVAAAKPGNSAPFLVPPPEGGAWSREGVLGWLNALSEETAFLAGFDFSFTPPYVDEGAYFPGTGIRASAAPDLWREVEARANGDAHLYAGSFAEAGGVCEHFLANGSAGARFKRRFRATELTCRAKGLGPAESFFHLIGPTQVGLASLSGMRMLRRLDPYVSVWPFDEADSSRPVVVEIYARAFQETAGGPNGKIRDAATLNKILSAFGTAPVENSLPLTSHAADALLSAAALRHLSKEEKYWNPKGLTKDVQSTEGWTFGVP